MARSTLTRKGQTTVPKEVRDALGLKAGDHIRWEREGAVVRVTPAKERLLDLEGILEDDSDRVVTIVRKARALRGDR